jgi:poly(hydroxyalkanoate) depolymerase family esterase
MNPLFQRLMRRASRLTRAGSLQEATRAIQQALGVSAPAPQQPTAFTSPTVAAANDDHLVVDVEARVLDTSAPDLEAEIFLDLSEAPAASSNLFDVPPAAAELREPAPAPAIEPEAWREAEPGIEQWRDGLFAHQHRQIAYKLFVPALAAGSAAPLVLMLHGCTQHPEDFAAGTQMNALARAHGFLVLYPAQTQRANSSRCWNWFKPQHQQRGRGEPALLAALTQSVVESEGVDPDRVYVAGLSAGGAMADILGRAYPDLFAAVGVHSGLPAGAASDLMSALAAMKKGAAPAPGGGLALPTIVFHGDADATVHVRNAEGVVAAALGGQDGVTAEARSSSGESAGGRRFTRHVHAGAEGRPAVEHWLLHGAGHAWSGGSAQGSYTDPAGPDASAEMLRFFLAQRRRRSAAVEGDAQPG